VKLVIKYQIQMECISLYAVNKNAAIEQRDLAFGCSIRDYIMEVVLDKSLTQ